jgi:hypothetical protein
MARPLRVRRPTGGRFRSQNQRETRDVLLGPHPRRDLRLRNPNPYCHADGLPFVWSSGYALLLATPHYICVRAGPEIRSGNSHRAAHRAATRPREAEQMSFQPNFTRPEFRAVPRRSPRVPCVRHAAAARAQTPDKSVRQETQIAGMWRWSVRARLPDAPP